MQDMSTLFDPLNVILATIVILVGFKLWQILGQRTGFEKLPPLPSFTTEPKASDVVVNQTDSPPKPIWQGFAVENSELAQGLMAIAKSDTNFDPKTFLVGARIAHERVLEAFAKSDVVSLKFLLTKTIYAVFEKEIARRKQAGESAYFKFVGINSAKITTAKMQANAATIDVEFVSQIISALKNKQGAILQGSETALDEVKELWTFERDVTVRDPNWKLVETHDHD